MTGHLLHGPDLAVSGSAGQPTLSDERVSGPALSVAQPGDRPLAEVVEVRRSARRRKTVSAYRDGSTVVVLVPSRFTPAEEEHWVDVVRQRLAAAEARRNRGESELSRRAEQLSRIYLGGRARPTSVKWVTNQRSRWGSCSADGTIRLSHRLQGMPVYVQDYVLLHELAHLLQRGHGAEFWRLLEGVPFLERARGFLEGVSVAGSSDRPQ